MSVSLHFTPLVPQFSALILSLVCRKKGRKKDGAVMKTQMSNTVFTGSSDRLYLAPACDTLCLHVQATAVETCITITRSVWHHSFTRLLFLMPSFPMAIPVITHLSSWG